MEEPPNTLDTKSTQDEALDPFTVEKILRKVAEGLNIERLLREEPTLTHENILTAFYQAKIALSRYHSGFLAGVKAAQAEQQVIIPLSQAEKILRKVAEGLNIERLWQGERSLTRNNIQMALRTGLAAVKGFHQGILESQKRLERVGRKGYIAGATTATRQYHMLTTEYGLTDEQANEVMDHYFNTIVKEWAENVKTGKKPFTPHPPEIEIPERYTKKRQQET